MIKVVWNVLKKIFGAFFCILSPVKRLICRRKRHSSDTILPLVNHYTVPINTESELEPWDSWGAGDQPAASKTDQYGQYPEFSRSSSVNKNMDPETESEMDFFQGMQPEVKKTAKIRLKKNDAELNTSAIANRLAASTDIAILPGSDLGAWVDSANAWEDSNTDMTWQAEAEMKENRRKEREVRSQEQQRKVQERAARKALKPDGHFVAVRLS